MPKYKIRHLLSFCIKGRGPAWHESWLSAEPQHHQRNKNSKHSRFSEFHFAQFSILLLHHTVGLLIASIIYPTAKSLLKTEKKAKYQYLCMSGFL